MVLDDGWVEFEAPLELMAWGRNTYVVILLPARLEEICRAVGTRRVEGSVNGLVVNLGINRADVLDHAFVYAGRPLQRRLGAVAGDLVSLRLGAADPALVPLPADVSRALNEAGSLGVFEERRPSERRRLLAEVDASASEATRQR